MELNKTQISINTFYNKFTKLMDRVADYKAASTPVEEESFAGMIETLFEVYKDYNTLIEKYNKEYNEWMVEHNEHNKNQN